jgi:hypothetical protein
VHPDQLAGWLDRQSARLRADVVCGGALFGN